VTAKIYFLYLVVDRESEGGFWAATTWAEEVQVIARYGSFITAISGGKSGLQRAGCWIISSQGNLKESATENRLPWPLKGKTEFYLGGIGKR